MFDAQPAGSVSAVGGGPKVSRSGPHACCSESTGKSFSWTLHERLSEDFFSPALSKRLAGQTERFPVYHMAT